MWSSVGFYENCLGSIKLENHISSVMMEAKKVSEALDINCTVTLSICCLLNDCKLTKRSVREVNFRVINPEM
jgi:hypothetical protein